MTNSRRASSPNKKILNICSVASKTKDIPFTRLQRLSLTSYDSAHFHTSVVHPAKRTNSAVSHQMVLIVLLPKFRQTQIAQHVEDAAELSATNPRVNLRRFQLHRRVICTKKKTRFTIESVEGLEGLLDRSSRSR